MNDFMKNLNLIEEIKTYVGEERDEIKEWEEAGCGNIADYLI